MFPLLLLGIVLVLASALPWRAPYAGPVLAAAGYFAALLMLWQNRDRAWMPVVFVGAAMNAAVILANGGRMPVPRWAFERVGRPIPGRLLAGADPHHVLAGPGTALGWLDDRFALHAGQFALILSPGDLVLAVGVAGFVQAASLSSAA
jgi:hypothetical protein